MGRSGPGRQRPRSAGRLVGPEPVCARAGVRPQWRAVDRRRAHAFTRHRRRRYGVGLGRQRRRQLGNDSAQDSSIPVQVLNISGATAVAGGDGFSLAILSDATTQAWSLNDRYKLGTTHHPGPNIIAVTASLTLQPWSPTGLRPGNRSALCR